MVNAMAMKLYNDVDIQDIADAIRSVNGESTTYKVSEMASVISGFVLPKRGNMRDIIGYTDGQRLSMSDGGYRTAAAYTVVEYIDLAEYVKNGQVVIRTKGVDFWQNRNSSWRDSGFMLYNPSKVAESGGYLTSGSVTFHGTCVVTKSFDSNSDEMTLTIDGLDSTILSLDRYLRMCGYGSGANLDIRINEDFS